MSAKSSQIQNGVETEKLNISIFLIPRKIHMQRPFIKASAIHIRQPVNFIPYKTQDTLPSQAQTHPIQRFLLLHPHGYPSQILV